MPNSMNAADSQARRRLRIADHMRTCVIDDQVVLLGLHRSRYLSLSSRHWQVLQSGLAAQNASNETVQHDDALFAPLVRNRILTAAPIKGHPIPHMLPSPVASFDVSEETPNASIRFRHLVAFVAATSLAALWLRFRSLRSISQEIEARHTDCGSRDPATHAERLRRAVVIFDRLRPLAFTSREKCLYDSLALVIFLARQGVAARWVIGVTTRPFRAHAWVQDGCEVLNDLHENVSRYTPIHTV